MTTHVEEPAAVPKAAMARILVVDDSRMVRATISKHLRERFEIREDVDGEAAWETLLVDPEIRLLISDLGMPKLDGFGLLERLRASKIPRIRDMPVIIISGDEDQSSRERARALGASDFVTKGTGTVELVARCESLVALAVATRELEESRHLLAKRSPVDARYGLLSQQYFRLQGTQALSLAKRHYGELNALVLDIDGLDRVRADHGDDVVSLVVRKLAKILGTRVRREDGVTHLSDARFAVVAPGIGISACSAFALRLKEAIAGLALSYRGDTLRVSLTIGLANYPADAAETFEDLLLAATARLDQGAVFGGNCVVGAQGVIFRPPRAEEVFSVERALMLLREGKPEEVRPFLGGLVRRLLPMLELAEHEFGCTLPLATLAQACNESGNRAEEEESSADGDTPP